MPQNKELKQKLEQLQRMQKQTNRKDYYRILGVPRTATKREINKAYRKLAVQWHPDKVTTPEEKKTAEAKFIELAAAKEVLTDDEKRRRYDLGEDPLDPLDPQQQQQQHFYQQHFSQQGGTFFNPFGSFGGFGGSGGFGGAPHGQQQQHFTFHFG